MERESDLQALPDPAAIIVVASCENKNALRQTSKRFCEFASRRKNENILVQPQLYLTQEALDRYLLYYGALGNTAIVSNLLAKGANPNAREDDGTTLMHHAVRCGYDDIAKILSEHPDLIKQDLSSIKKPDLDNHLCVRCINKPKKLLHSMIQQGRYEAVKYLLAHNVSANVVNKKSENALYCATECGHINIMELLISKGARISGDRYGTFGERLFALDIAARNGHTSAVQLLIDYGAKVTMCENLTLWRVCRDGYMQIFKIFLSQGVKVGERGLLNAAARGGHIQMAKILLENRADVNEAWCDHNKPLDVASNENIKKLLIAHGATESYECRCIVQ